MTAGHGRGSAPDVWGLQHIVAVIVSCKVCMHSASTIAVTAVHALHVCAGLSRVLTSLERVLDEFSSASKHSHTGQSACVMHRAGQVLTKDSVVVCACAPLCRRRALQVIMVDAALGQS